MSNAPVPPLLPVYKRAAVTFERGEGAWLYDREGRRYLDFGSGIAVTLLGHAHPHLVAILKAQAEKLWHCSNLYGIAAQEQLAERLVAQSFADTVFFGNSGAEALECAIKMARRFQFHRGQPERIGIITFEGAFHGRTIATISAAGQEKHLEGFRPELPGFEHVPLGDLARVEAAIGPRTAAILIEPVQGEGGIRPAEAGFLAELRRLADEHDLLLIFDEVQTGMGRSGRLFAYQWSGVTPDIMTLAKGLGGGFPIGACLA
ncbi:MAG TPA: aspartate aminotransferase family protein, partial [Geminicoccaceae bacterium]|nr:aspartate aminotransferase family protein [Geminicoccaceae bacterium]